MARKKIKYELTLKSLEIPNSLDYWEWDWGYYDDCLTEPGECVEVVYSYINESIDIPYKIIDMESIYPKEVLRERKINRILGIKNENTTVTIGDFIKNNKKA